LAQAGLWQTRSHASGITAVMWPLVSIFLPASPRVGLVRFFFTVFPSLLVWVELTLEWNQYQYFLFSQSGIVCEFIVKCQVCSRGLFSFELSIGIARPD
jgi:hypothetical protein